ncbi:hypothetical protein AVEN_132740-1 [Araneus ventricosus]|uniref:Uncharacterized protein n=1 Tax=Araneus ventricosus TaxID=182803 RepID=A0A4Y2PL81_ARAVE|nr:hypothetical protein AVEN_132740-1 [Araneus ventricosus]
MPRLEPTQELFWDGPHNFEPQSDDEDDTRAGTPSPNFRTTPKGGHSATTYNLARNRPPYTADLQWNQIWNLIAPRPYCWATTAIRKGMIHFNLISCVFE